MRQFEAIGSIRVPKFDQEAVSEGLWVSDFL